MVMELERERREDGGKKQERSAKAIPLIELRCVANKRIIVRK